MSTLISNLKGFIYPSSVTQHSPPSPTSSPSRPSNAVIALIESVGHVASNVKSNPKTMRLKPIKSVNMVTVDGNGQSSKRVKEAINYRNDGDSDRDGDQASEQDEEKEEPPREIKPKESAIKYGKRKSVDVDIAVASGSIPTLKKRRVPARHSPSPSPAPVTRALRHRPSGVKSSLVATSIKAAKKMVRKVTKPAAVADAVPLSSEEEQEGQEEDEKVDQLEVDSGTDKEGDEEGDEEGEEEEEDDDEAMERIHHLEQKALYKSFKFANLEDRDIQLQPGNIITVNESTWLGQITHIRGMRRDMSSAVDDDGQVRKTAAGKTIITCDPVYLRVRWLYNANQFAQIGKDWRWSKELSFMDKKEFVPTSSEDWYQTDMVQHINITAYFFNDLYPADKGRYPHHPLHLYKDHNLHDIPDCSLPMYLFDGPDDWEKGVVRWTRREGYFNFTAPADHGPSKWKPDQLIFNKHPTRGLPYSPDADVQHYSMHAKTWYSVKDLYRQQGYADRAKVIANEERFKDGRLLSFDYSVHKDSVTDILALGQIDGEDHVETVSVLTHLLALSRSTLYRGQCYGVIGNTYMVRRAQELVHVMQMQLDFDEIEVEAVLQGAREWREEVEERTAQMAAREIQRIDPPTGQVWVCPKTGRAI